MKKKATRTPPTEAEARALYEKIMERDRNDKRPFLTLAFDSQIRKRGQTPNLPCPFAVAPRNPPPTTPRKEPPP